MSTPKKNIDYAGYVPPGHPDYAFQATCSCGHNS